MPGLLDLITGGFTGPGTMPGGGGGWNLGGLLSGVTGSTNPLYDIMALINMVNEGELTSTQSDWMNKVLGYQSSALNDVMNPATFNARVAGMTPTPISDPFSPASTSAEQLGSEAAKAAGQLDPRLVSSVTNPVQAQLAASGRAASPTVSQYVTQQALAPYEQQNLQTGTQMAEASQSQQTAIDQMQLQKILQDAATRLQQQQMGISTAEFGPSFAESMPYGLPNFSMMNPTDMTSLLSMLSGASGGAAGGGSWTPGMTGNPSLTSWWNASGTP